MTPTARILALTITTLLLLHPSTAFTFSPGSRSPTVLSPRHLSSRQQRPSFILHAESPEELMAAAQKLREEAATAEEKKSEEVEMSTAVVDPTAKSSGDLYDDEVEEADAGSGLSDTMRDRLLREAQGLGADPNSKQENYIVWLAVVVGVLVVAGGKGIFY